MANDRSVVVNCKYCKANFYSEINNMDILATFINNKEYCPKCKNECETPNGRFILYKNQRRFVLSNTSATQIASPEKLDLHNTVYVVLGEDKPLGTTWKFFLNKNDFYICCREVADFKISLHASGSHNLGFTDQHHRNSKKLESRHFYRINRPLPYLAHLVRAARIILSCNDTWKNYNGVRIPKMKALSKINRPIPNGQVFAIDVFYSIDSPNEFVETRFSNDKLLGSFLSKQGIYYIIVSVSDEDLNSVHAFGGWKQLAERQQAGPNDLSVSINASASEKNTLLIEAIHF